MDDEDIVPLTRAPPPPKGNKKPFSKAHPSLHSLVVSTGPTKLSEAVERHDRDKPNTIAPEHVEKLLAEMDVNNNGVRVSALSEIAQRTARAAASRHADARADLPGAPRPVPHASRHAPILPAAACAACPGSLWTATTSGGTCARWAGR
jgi:hypothetical protein